MPTVLSEAGFQVMIYTHDHEPMHVHVFHAEESVVVNLLDFTVRGVYMNNRNVKKAVTLVARHQEFLLSEWYRIDPIA